MTHQIDQLKEEIQNKEQALVKGKTIFNRLLLKIAKFIHKI